jgi:glycosyltransferase involved in cell wall biosynthesis
MKTLVSILIPAYNAEEWIAETLQSAVSQTWENKEIIVVDDGSKDGTFEAARKFSPQGVRVVKQENQGAAAARNKALSLCQGSYIQWLDADDLLSPDKISRQMAVAQDRQDNRLLLSCAWGGFMYRPKRANFQPTPLWNNLKPAEWLIRKLGQNLYMQPATWLVSRELTEAAGLWNTELKVDDDGEYFCRVLLQSSEVEFVPAAKVYYRASGSGSLSYIGLSDAKMASQLESMRLHIAYLRSMEDSDRARAACVQFLQNWIPFIYPNRPDLVKESERMAAELGGKLEMPALSWKYFWIKSILGWNSAKRAQLLLPRMKWSVIRFMDKALYRWGDRKGNI